MKILVIAANCLKLNSSANLCHISYINGLINSGHTVDLITASDKGTIIDENITIPPVRNLYEFNVSLYDILYKHKNNNSNYSKKEVNSEAKPDTREKSYKTIISNAFNKIKKFIHDLYGVYETSIIWYQKAKKFKSDEQYDIVISLSFPPTSHLLAIYLKNKNKVSAKKWMQIWEDPWSCDLLINAINSNKKHRTEEIKLLNNASDILYVSPITLKYQQNMFPDNAHKMRWAPLPTYYKAANQNVDFSELYFGYFGDYNSKVRNIIPFYNAAKNNNLNFTICGATDLDINSTNTVSVYPRLPLSELEKYETKANVLVFLCNLKGGQIPGKIYQYSATNKFILFILDGTDEEKNILKDYFSKYNRYVFCENNEKSIMDAINYIKKNVDKTELYAPIDDFEATKIIKEILES